MTFLRSQSRFLSKLAAWSLLLCAILPAQAETLTVALAASVQYPFEALSAAFTRATGHVLQPVVGSSGKLSAQIANGAPYDVFLSADMEYPEALFRQGLALAAPRPYAYGLLVLWTVRPELDLVNWQTTLASGKVKSIAVANPKLAPYGEQSMKALAFYRLDDGVRSKLIFGENIGQTNQYIHSGSADIGFTAKSVVLAPEMAGHGRWVDLPRASYQPVAQGAVILRHGMESRPETARAFNAFLYGPQARKIFAQYGYLLP
jgi:molybdate transport system substrate-binding protein